MRKILTTMGGIMLVLFFVFPFVCYEHRTRSSEVVIYPDSKYLFKLQFKEHIVGRGNIHTYSCNKYEFDSSDWIYIKKRLGVLDTSYFIFTHHYGKTYDPWGKDLRGTISLTEDSVDVRLQFPVYQDGVNLSGWIDWKWNGQYKLRFDSLVSIYDANPDH